MAVRSNTTGGIGRREPCLKCGMPVFLAERLNVGNQLYHRTCFRCARCNNQLSLANYYETEVDGQYCCETCPDEELKKSAPKTTNIPDESKLLEDTYSSNFETALELPLATGHSPSESVYSNARSRFISKIVDLTEPEVDDVPPDLPKSKPPQEVANSTLVQDSQSVNITESVSLVNAPDVVNITSDVSTENQPQTANEEPNVSSEKRGSIVDNIQAKDVILSASNSSLVKARMKLFENSSEIDYSKISLKTVSSRKEEDCKRSDLNSNVSVSVDSKSVDLSCHVESREDVKIEDIKEQMEVDEHTSEVDIKENTAEELAVFKEEDLATIEDNTNEENIEVDTKKDSPKEDISPVAEVSIEECKKDTIEDDISTKKDADIMEQDEKPSEDKSHLLEDSVITVSSDSQINESAIDLDDNKTSEPVNDSIVSISSDSQNVTKETETSDSLQIVEIPAESQTISDEDSPKKEDISSDCQEIIASTISEEQEAPSAKELQTSEPPTETSPTNELKSPEVPEIKITKTSTSASKKEEDYPEDLNPFDEEDDEVPDRPIPAKRKIRPPTADWKITGVDQDTPEELKTVNVRRLPSLNPFGDSDEEEEEKSKPSQVPEKKVIKAPKISFNPFWSDGEEPEDEEEATKGKATPTPTPRPSRNMGTPDARPRASNLSASGISTGGFYGSSSSISSASSNLGQTPGRKKKPAPPPPVLKTTDGSAKNSQSSSPATSLQSSPKSTLKYRKNRKAPLPPTSTPMVSMDYQNPSITTTVSNDSFSPILSPQTEEDKLSNTTNNVWEIEKTNKDERNRNRQSQGDTPQTDDINDGNGGLIPDKSTFGKWKRKKGPAPARPVPQRRAIRAMPIEEVKRELEVIEMQQQGLEKQGVRLEQIIRDRCETANIDPDTTTDPEVEDLILQLFELVNEKNELFRKQAELMYLRRQQRLEEEHADLEYQIRCLMDQSEVNKTDRDKAREEELIKRLVDVVERRNEIIECLEMDRVRENQEDDSISTHLNQLALKREEETLEKSMDSVKIEKKKQKKDKKFKLKSKSDKVDADKDIDESETSSTTETLKKKKKKWFS